MPGRQGGAADPSRLSQEGPNGAGSFHPNLSQSLFGERTTLPGTLQVGFLPPALKTKEISKPQFLTTLHKHKGRRLHVHDPGG